PVALSREHRQYRLFETISHILRALAARRAPLVLVLDDLQWADRSSLELLCSFMERVANEPVLIIGAARSEDLGAPLERVRHQGVRLGMLDELMLQRLSEHEIHELVSKLAAELETTADFGGELYRESMGNPLLVTAVLHALFENGACVAEGTRWRLSDPSRIELAPSLDKQAFFCYNLLLSGDQI
ncbi:MAG: AAA family ATPase, partial [Candidatus Caldarchaeum sp.]